ncbi:MAG: LysM peptidoglycan-binding domain-containing protein [Kouleothrix sp.]|nr:LysM peptidoglycan-binding domain-containing protein [Kouleothrix sp.]
MQATATGPTSAPQPTPDATQPAPVAQDQPTAEPSTAAPPDATAEPSTPVASPSYVEYTVQKGDLLYTIALKNDVTIEDILAINQIANPESLTVGQIIRIPKR